MKRVRQFASLDGHLVNLLMFLFLSALASGQTASLRGQVVDQSGAVIPKSTVTLTAASGVVKTTTAAENGSYSFQALPPGQYTVQAAAPKLEQEPVPIVLNPGLNLAACGGRRAIEMSLICQEDCLARESAVCLPQRCASMLAGSEPEKCKSGLK